MNKTRW